MAEYQLGYTGANINTLLGKITPMETTVNNLNNIVSNKFIFLTNTTVATTAWAADTTYTAYPYRAKISNSSITATDYCEIIFSLTDAISGYFAPICESIAGGIYIYATAIPVANITIPTIKCTKTT